METRLRNIIAIVFCLALGASLLATAPVPRKSPDLKFLDASDKEIPLSSFSGKVVLVEFLVTDCPRCARAAQMIDGLNHDLGKRGFQPIGIAFDSGITGPAVTTFTRDFGITYLLGYASSDKVDSYLGRGSADRFRVPQIVVIDRKGIIRAQSRPTGEQDLESEKYLRNLIEALLQEEGPFAAKTISTVLLDLMPAAVLLVLGGLFIWMISRGGSRTTSTPR